MAELIALEGDYCDIKVRRALANSKVLSADVSAGYDPNFEKHMKREIGIYGKWSSFN